MAKVFTMKNIKEDINDLIDKYVGDSESETAFVQQNLNAAFAVNGTILYPTLEELVLDVFQNPTEEYANNKIAEFSYGVHLTCPISILADAMVDILGELITDFCFG